MQENSGIEKPNIKDEENVLEKLPTDIKDISDLTHEELVDLQKRLDLSHGLARFFVHPFFTKYNKDYPEKHAYGGNPNEALSEKELAIGSLIKKLASMEKQKTPPIFVVEEKDWIDAFRKEIGDHILGQDLYLIKSQNNLGDPVKGWENVFNQLKEIGLKKVLLAGMKMDLHPTENGEIEYGHKCAAIWGRNMSQYKDFEVELSALTFPEGRMDRNV